MGCIYTVINLLTGKQYIGGTVHSAKSRWNSHIREAKKHKPGSEGSKHPLIRAIHKYGPDTFEVRTLHKSVPEEMLGELELKYISKFDTLYPNGYNLTRQKHSATKLARARMRKARLGNNMHSAETKAKISAASSSHRFTAEDRAKMSRIAKANKASERCRRDSKGHWISYAKH